MVKRLVPSDGVSGLETCTSNVGGNLKLFSICLGQDVVWMTV